MSRGKGWGGDFGELTLGGGRWRGMEGLLRVGSGIV